MLIFWELVLEKDKHLFLNADNNVTWNESRFAGWEPTYKAKVINYSLATIFLVIFFASNLLNSLLLKFFSEKSGANLHDVLFRCLAFFDLMTNLFTPLLYSVLMFIPTIYPLSSSLLMTVKVCCCTFGCSAQVTTFLLAATRFFKVVFPFGSIRSWVVLVYMGLYFAFMSVNNAIYLFVYLFFTELESISGTGIHMCIYANLVHCIGGVLFSLATVLILYLKTKKSGVDSTKYIKSCVTLLIMNSMYVFVILVIVHVKFLLVFTINFHDILFAWIPMFTSTMDPIIIITRRKSVRRRVRDMLCEKFNYRDTCPVEYEMGPTRWSDSHGKTTLHREGNSPPETCRDTATIQDCYKDINGTTCEINLNKSC